MNFIKKNMQKIRDIFRIPPALRKYLPKSGNEKNEEELKLMEKIEEDFKEGNIILPSGKIDYKDFEEFKKKTSHIKSIQIQLKIVEKHKPKGLVELKGMEAQKDGK